MKIRVLFVDDEPKLLEGLQRSLRTLRGEWDMHFSGSGQEALACLGVKAFDVIVTDMRMPGMDGVALLQTVADKHPDLLRIVLSGQSDLESVVKASGVAHQYLSKPCPQEGLKEAIVHAFALSERLKNPKLRSLIAGIDALPSLPQSFRDLTTALDSPDSSAGEIGGIISRDIAMSSKILQLMNSAFFGRSRRISDPVDAVNYIGTSAIKALVLGAHAFRCFDNNLKVSFDVQELWTHSNACSVLAEKIGKDLDPGNKELPNQARTAGLLHDIGRLVVACKLPDKFEEIADTAAATKVNLWEAEYECLGVSHAEIGAYLLTLWGLPTRIVEAVAYHHRPYDCQSSELSPLALVHMACALLNPDDATAIDEAYIERIGYAPRFSLGRESWSSWLGTAA